MSKKQQTALGLAPAAPTISTPTSSSLTHFQPGRKLTKSEQWVINEWYKERLVIEATAAKTMFAQSKMGDINQHAASVFDETVNEILAIKDRGARSQEHQLYVDEFSTRQIQLTAKHLLGASEVGAHNIAVEVDRSFYPPAEQPKKRTFLQRLFAPEE